MSVLVVPASEAAAAAVSVDSTFCCAALLRWRSSTEKTIIGMIRTATMSIR